MIKILRTKYRKNIDKERRLDQFIIEDEKAKSDEAELVKNIDELIYKERQTKKLESYSSTCLKEKSVRLTNKLK